MRVVSWNIQWGRGADGVVDLARTLAVLRATAADVVCLQEVACHFAGLAGAVPEDQPARIWAAFPGWFAFYVPGVAVLDQEGRACGFGNLILSRFPLGQVWAHRLPWPADAGVPSMQRSCAEAVVHTPDGAVRVLTTHLEYYSALQRLVQAEALRAVQVECLAHLSAPPGGGEKDGPFRPRTRPAAAILCGDFNCEPGSPAYLVLTREDADGPVWVDAWCGVHSTPHANSVGLHGADWPDYPFCCDFVFVSPGLRHQLQAIHILQDTAASDHQPVILDLELSLPGEATNPG